MGGQWERRACRLTIPSCWSQLLAKASKAALKSHKERVAEFNEQLEAKSEHYDIPKASFPDPVGYSQTADNPLVTGGTRLKRFSFEFRRFLLSIQLFRFLLSLLSSCECMLYWGEIQVRCRQTKGRRGRNREVSASFFPRRHSASGFMQSSVER